jgi:predicted RNA-binding Zn-ribbon protein involved in translation (DUF1610 family)
MRAKCPKCGNVFEFEYGIALIHMGPYAYMKCPACGKRTMMNRFARDPVTWPREDREVKEKPQTDEELEKKRIEESKYEKT